MSYSGNRLSKEKSLYLQQHASNPINWFPWSEDAFKKAEKENKLLLISIGYSSCHWCHVMEKEVFENPQAASYLNEHFICIKVDREERPDVDHVYMTAVQLMTQSGGWPLNCFTLPDGRPVYGGTYFPLQQFMNILTSLQKIYHENRDEMDQYASNLEKGIKTADYIKVNETQIIEESKLHTLVEKWASSFDWNDGGQKRAPKFPLPNNYEFLLQYGKYFGEEAIVEFTHLTLHKIIRGGIYDQPEGGLMRYSVDMYWKEPHFEKMLYDNGQFLSVIAKACNDRPSLEYKWVLEQTVSWLETKMQSQAGLYKSSIDADANGEEGSYYIWKKEELQAILKEDFEKAEEFYQINGNGFWKNGNYILLRTSSFHEFSEHHQLPADTFKSWLKNINSKLLDVRSRRIAPVIDDKIIFSWNCMIAIGLIDAAIALNDVSHFNRAVVLVEQLENTFVSPDLIFRINDDANKIEGFLDDYVYYVKVCIQLHQYTLDDKWINKAIKWIGKIQELFETKGELFYYSGEDALLIAKTLEINDNVIPSSNSVLANCFWDLGVICSDENWLNKAKAMLQHVYEGMDHYGSGYSNWAILLQKVIKGDLSVNYLSEISRKEHLQQLKKLQDIVLFKKDIQAGITNSYQICHNKNCFLPEKDFGTILEKIQQLLNQ